MEEALLPNSIQIEKRSKDGAPKPLTTFQIKVMLALCFVNFCSCTGFTLLTTFFPHETMTVRSITATQNSFIFAVYALINIFACPIFGYFLPSIGARPMLLAGIWLSAIGALLFSFLYLEMDPFLFTVYACLVRVVQAFACSMYLTAAYSIMTHVWSDRRSQAVGLLEMTTGCGMIVGPMVGSALYNVGGFGLPFQALCIFLAVGSIPAGLILRNLNMSTSNGQAITNSVMLSSRLYSGDFTEQLTLRQFLSIFTNPATYATILLTILCWSAMDFVMPGLEIHVGLMFEQHIGIETITTKTGILFVVFAIAYGLGTPLVGKLCTSWGTKSSRPCMLVGGFLIFLSYLFIGPQEDLANWTGLASFGVQRYLGGLVHVSIIFVLLGIGLALVAVPSVEDLVQCCYKVGLPKDGIATVAVVSGFYNCILFIGEFVGPFAQGLIYDHMHNKLQRPGRTLDETKVVTETYFWWSIICLAITVASALIYGLEWILDTYCKDATKPKRVSVASIGEASTAEQESLAQHMGTSAVFGPQSFSMSMSNRRHTSTRMRTTVIGGLPEYE